ncbi:MAG: hypothetical protein ACTSUE_14310 [Promethearchaeota archaeon]
MSYIPKYILKRMIAKDAVKNTDDGWKVDIKNVISPLSVDEIPENVIDMFTITVDDVEVDKTKVSLGFEDKKISIENPQEALGVTVPVGGIIVLECKGEKLSPGSHKFKLEIAAGGDMSIEFEREVE